MLYKIDKQVPYSKQTYSSLKEAIITNTLKPGEILNERDISERLSVSRTPLREAFQLLQNEGWIIQSGKNKIVAPITWKDIQEIYELRMANEIYSMELAIKNVNKEHLEEIKKCLSEMAQIKSADVTKYLQQDKKFHLSILEMANNKKLLEFMNSIFEQFIRIGFITFRKDNHRAEESYNEHLEIYNAIESGDVDKAKEVSRKHILASYNAIKENWDGGSN